MSQLNFLLLIAVLDLAGVFFGVQMLLSCFKDRARYTVLEKYRFTVICQFVYQITILATNTVEAWRLVNYYHEESSCSVISLLSNSVNFFLICNAMAMVLIHYQPVVLDLNPTFSPKLVRAASLVTALVASAILSWFSCFCQNCITHVVFCIFVWLLAVAVVTFVAWRTCKHLRHLEHTTSEAPQSCDKKAIFYSLCFGLIVMLFCLYMYQNLEETKIFKEALYLLAINFIVGVVFPVSFKDLIDSNFGQSCKETVENLEC